jgi:4-carboxymuconolactone decarboxylase
MRSRGARGEMSDMPNVGANMIEHQERLRSLALSDAGFVDSVLGMGQDTVEISRLDPKTHALVRLTALLVVDAGQSSYNASVEVALASGASLDEIVGILIAVAPAVGLGRVVSAAPELGLALGYDVESALEAQECDIHRPVPSDDDRAVTHS